MVEVGPDAGLGDLGLEPRLTGGVQGRALRLRGVLGGADARAGIRRRRRRLTELRGSGLALREVRGLPRAGGGLLLGELFRSIREAPALFHRVADAALEGTPRLDQLVAGALEGAPPLGGDLRFRAPVRELFGGGSRERARLGERRGELLGGIPGGCFAPGVAAFLRFERVPRGGES